MWTKQHREVWCCFFYGHVSQKQTMDNAGRFPGGADDRKPCEQLADSQFDELCLSGGQQSGKVFASHHPCVSKSSAETRLRKIQ